MVEFSPAILAHLVVCGYKCLKVEPRDKFHIIEPLTDPLAAVHFEANNAYAIEIDDPQALEMTGRLISLPDHKFYIDEQYIK